MSGSRKKVIVRRFSSGVVPGYLPAAGFVMRTGPTTSIDLLDVAGRGQPIPLHEVKYISFVRDFNTADAANPERLLRKTFLKRPRTEGLWVRLTFKDDDLMEGLAPLDLSLMDGLVDDAGIQIVPPDVRGNTQRLYVPRSAIQCMQIVAVVTTPSRKLPLPPQVPTSTQSDLFSVEFPPNTRPQ